MKIRQLRTLSVLLIMGLATTTAWSGQNVPAASATGARAGVSADTSAKSAKDVDKPKAGLPSIINEEEIPAFLLTDPCDTEDS
jgi:hypothetical protein